MLAGMHAQEQIPWECIPFLVEGTIPDAEAKFRSEPEVDIFDPNYFPLEGYL